MEPVICGGGIGARCVRKSSFVRGSPLKTGVAGKGKNSSSPLHGVGYDEGASPPRPAPGGTGRGKIIACAYYVDAKVVRV